MVEINKVDVDCGAAPVNQNDGVVSRQPRKQSITVDSHQSKVNYDEIVTVKRADESESADTSPMVDPRPAPQFKGDKDVKQSKAHKGKERGFSIPRSWCCLRSRRTS